MKRTFFFCFSTILVVGLLWSCRPRQSGSGLKDDDGTPTPLPQETLHNLVLQFGHSPKLNFSGGAPWTKFVLTVADEKIYFMNANEQKFHYEFAVKHIPMFKNMLPNDFDQVTLFNGSRKAISGGVINLNGAIAFDLVSNDVLEHDFAIKILKAAKAAVFSEYKIKFAYMPVFNQSAAVFGNRAKYEQEGIELFSPVDASPETAIYSEGWSFGRLVEVPHDKIDEEFAAGRLKPTDILYTNGVPAEIPVLAGVISSYPATPNSHVAILSKSFQIPFAFTRSDVTRDRLKSLINKEIIIKAEGNSLWGNLEIHTPPLTVADRKALSSLRTPTGLKYPEKKSYKAVSGKIHKRAIDMASTDSHFFGGKAANFRVLSAAVPDNSPKEAIGLSFDVWDEFLTTAKAAGKPLKDYIKDELGAVSYPPADIPGLKAKLAKVRAAIKDAKFPDALRSQIIDALQANGFVNDRKIRFRSSTNVEDGDSFSGAGLYDSYSACLGDDIGNGSSTVCPASNGDAKPKKVVSAVRKVFASFYNDNAFLERIRRGVNPETVGMAMAVHYSFPDENELANGVIVTEESDNGFQALVVSQAGADSVANPSAGNRPEEVSLWFSERPAGGYDVGINVQTYAQKLPVGQLVLGVESQYQSLGEAIAAIQKEYRKHHGISGDLSLDIEYKLVKESSGPKLIVKQVRIVPAPKKGQQKYYVLGREIPLCLVQSGSFSGGWESLVSQHYLKGAGSIKVRSGWLDNLVGRRDFITAGKINFTRADKTSPVDLNRLTKIESKLEQTPFGGTALSVRAGGKRNLFGKEHDLEVKGQFHLDDKMPVVISGRPSNHLGSPAFMLTVESRNTLSDYANTAQKLSVDFFACDENLPMDESVSRTVDAGTAKLDVEYTYSSTTFYKQEQNLAHWKKSRITGLTTEPIEIKNDTARTYTAGHHNFHEMFFFEPALDPSLSAGILAELKEKNIKAIFAELAFSSEGGIRVIGFDNQVSKIGTSKALVDLPLPGGDGDSSDGGGDGGIDWDDDDVNGPVGQVIQGAPQGLIGF